MSHIEREPGWALARDLVAGAWTATATADRMTAGSANKYLVILMTFTNFAEAHGCRTPGAVSPDLCSTFLGAPSRSGCTPSASTSRLRLTVIRRAYRVLLDSGLAHSDPTAGLQVRSARAEWRPCPLTPPEVDRLRNSGRTAVNDTLRPTVVELCLAGAAHSEVALTVVSDIHLETGDLRLAAGTPRERVVRVPRAGLTALRRRVSSQQRLWRQRRDSWNPATVPLAMHRPVAAYQVTSVAPTVSMNVSRALARAGVARPGVRPRSLREFSANRTYALTGRVEDTAQALGLASFDTTIHYIDPDWQNAWGALTRTSQQDHEAEGA